MLKVSAAENVNFSGVNVEPEGMDMNLTSSSCSHEPVALHVLHLQQGVDHGQLVRQVELLVHVNVGLELFNLVQSVQKQRFPKLGCF